MTKLPLVIVEWLDAVDWESPVSLEEASSRHRPELVISVGWLLKDDEVGVLLADEYYDEMYRRMEFIPRVNIRSVTHYKLVRPRTKPSGPRKVKVTPDP